MKFIKNQFRDKQQYHLFFSLCLATLFCFMLILVRLFYQNDGDLFRVERDAPFYISYLFLLWNLFLAWLPYLVSLTLERWNSKILIGITLMAWLVLFPNAPYIITDFLHLKTRLPIPRWYDVMLLFSFSFTGLMLGLFSLLEVHRYLRQKCRKRIAHFLVLFTIPLCGFGIYIGRFLRWNSWDVITRPHALFVDLLNVLSQPVAHFNTLGLALVISIFLMITYQMLYVLVEVRE